jgi:hypothetical protein
MRPDPGKERQGDRRPDKARDDVAEGDATAGGLAISRALDEGIERSADVRADDQRDRRVQRHDAFLGEGHHEQHHRHARMRGPVLSRER